MSEVKNKRTDSCVVIDLDVNRDLLNPNFDCYRVSIDPMVTFDHSLDSCVNELKLKDEEYSYLHLSMASHLNHLYSDPFSSQTVFFVTTFGQIICVSIELVSGRLTKPKPVYVIQDMDLSFISLSFPSNELSLISNSRLKNPVIHLMSTPSRSASEPWILLSTIALSDYSLRNHFHLFCSQSLDLLNTCLQIDFILCFVDKTNESNELNQNSTESPFISALNWFTITGNVNESNSWTVKRLRRMNGKDWPKYVSFDFIGSPFLCLVSEKDFKFVYDSDKPIVECNEEMDPNQEKKLLYTFCQTLEDIVVTFKLPVHISKSDVFIDLSPTGISVKIKDIIEFEGQLCHTIDSNSSVWTIQSEDDFQLLEITINKCENGLVWKEFIKGDKNCVEILSHELIEEYQQKLSHLTPEMPDIINNDFTEKVYDPMGLEECDFADKSLVFNRYNGNTHCISHRIDLSGNQWLFAIDSQKSIIDSDSSELPYFVIRHDVDALVWAPQSSPDINQFKVSHLSTFAAFGYVQASKTNTRFTVASHDLNYVVIADGQRHVYVYRQPTDIQSGEVRNRRTGQEIQSVAKQHVINLTDCQYIIGIHATNDNIFVLSNDKIFLIKL